MLLLVEGPAGSGKSQHVSDMLAAGELDMVADLTGQWAALRGLERGPDGRFPIRQDDDPVIASGLAAYMRAAAVRQGLRQGLRVAVTSGTPDSAVRWQRIAEEHGAAFSVVTIDPGEAVVRDRLAVDGELPGQCETAIQRWYAST